MGPPSVNFSDVGPIPPPRMFSDTSNPLAAHQMSDNMNNGGNAFEDDEDDEDDESGSCDRCDSPIPEHHNFGYKSTIPISIIKSDYEGRDSAVAEEEAPIKEPSLEAVPRKSALKKPRIAATSAIHFNPYSSSPTPSNSSHSSTKPQAPQPPGHPSHQMKPQVSPRFACVSYGNAPVQLLPTSASNSHFQNKPQVM